MMLLTYSRASFAATARTVRKTEIRTPSIKAISIDFATSDETAVRFQPLVIKTALANLKYA